MVKLLFIIKNRLFTTDSGEKKLIQTGLYNSSNYLNTVLNSLGIESCVDYAIDNNCIDRIVTKHKPTHAIIEALWVVPTKFNILCQLHPNIKWIIRFHSDMPFIACEGIAMSWISKYALFKNLYIACNAPRFFREVQVFLRAKQISEDEINKKVIYLPNYYSMDSNYINKLKEDKDEINICCFGAIRPLKNQLIQALASIDFATKINKKLLYHINGTRVETNGLAVYNNIKGLFDDLPKDKFELVEHDWYDKEDFLNVCSKMDIGLQVSFSETFNIVACDLLNQGVPIVCSFDIPWSNNTKYNANPTDSIDITNKLLATYENIEDNLKLNTESLKEYIKKTQKIWCDYFT